MKVSSSGLPRNCWKLDGLAILVDQREVGHLVAGLWNAKRRAALDLSVAVPGESDVLQLGVIAKHQRGVDLVAGRDGLEHPRVLVAHRKRHRHSLHQAGNVFVSNREFVRAGIDRDHSALQFITLAGGFAGAGDERSHKQKRDKKSAENTHTLSFYESRRYFGLVRR